MPLQYACLPCHLKHNILKKLSFKDYTHLIQSSKSAVDNAHLETIRFPHEVTELEVNQEGEVFFSKSNQKHTQLTLSLRTLIDVPIRIFAKGVTVKNCSSSTNQYKQATLTIEATKTKVNHVYCKLTDETPCEPEVFNDLIKSCKAFYIVLDGVESGTIYDYIYQPALKRKTVQIFAPLSFNEIRRLAWFSCLGENCTMSPKEFNLFLKNPNMYQFKFNHSSWKEKDVSTVLKDLPHFLLWSSNMHFASCFSEIPWKKDGARAYMVQPRTMTIDLGSTLDTTDDMYTLVYFDDTRCMVRFSQYRDFLVYDFGEYLELIAKRF